MSTRSAVKTGLRSVLEMELRKCLWLVDLGPGFSWTFIPSFSDPFAKENLPLIRFGLLFLFFSPCEVGRLGIYKKAEPGYQGVTEWMW